ncbi:MAG: ABC transporter substrate-binding protein [Magnetococcales bacterium]|nr:ABC transporter substrate-binding protein [Magnetococcales bacterium]
MAVKKQLLASTTRQGTWRKPVRLGLMCPLSGLVKIYGPEVALAARIATAEVNEKGGILGRPLELIIEDDGSLPQSAVPAAEKLIEYHGCVALIGNLLSNARIAVAYRVAEPRGIPLLNFSFYEGSILSRYFFHFAALPNQQIHPMIPYMTEKYGGKMYFAGNNYEWPRGSIDEAKRLLSLSGGEIAGEEYLPIGVDKEKIDELLQRVARSEAEVFMPFFAGADQMWLLTRFAEMGLKKRMAVVMGHFDEMMASQLTAGTRQGLYSVNTYFMSVATKANRRYLRRLLTQPGISDLWPPGNGILTNFGEGAYLCVKAFARAANRAGCLETEEIVRSLERLTVSSPQGSVRMDPATHHATVNTYLARCNAEGRFDIVKSFGAVPPRMPDRYGHLRIDTRAAREEDIRLQSRMMEYMTEGVCLVRAGNGLIVLCNRGLEKMLSRTRDEIVGAPVTRFIAPGNIPSDNTFKIKFTVPGHIQHDTTFNRVNTALYQKGYWDGEIQVLKKDDSPLWCSVSINTITHAEHGEVWMAVLQDISARKQAEEELRRYQADLEQTVHNRTAQLEEALQAAKEGARSKETFLVNMSHEIRTPMNGVLGMAELILRTPLTDQQRHFVATIHRSGRTLLRIINDVLDLSKIHAGHLTLELFRFDLRDILQDIRDIFTKQALYKGLSFTSHLDEAVPVHLIGDPYRFCQILYNLVGNALKFTEKGRIDLSVAIQEERDADVLLRFRVNDTGIGISPEFQRLLFRAFSQADPSVARQYGGTGLGLVISRNLVDLMDGELWVESTLGEGSTFWFTVRFGKQREGDRREIADWQAREVPDTADNIRFEARILLVEDNLVNQEVAQASLEAFGCRVTASTNGHRALEILESETTPFDAIFMDCEMPLLDGFETTRRIRRWEERTARRRTPIIALTAHVLNDSRLRCLESGMDDYLQKPFSQAGLGGTLRRWLPSFSINETFAETVETDRLVAEESPSGPESGDDLSRHPVLDAETVGRNTDLARKARPGLLDKMVGHYLERTPALLAELQQALRTEDAEGIRVAGHTLKSSSLTMGAVRLAELGRLLEADHRDMSRVARLLPEAAHLFEEVREALTELLTTYQAGEPHE